MRPEWVDYNRHMSDFRYGQVFGDAMDALFRRVGVDESYRDRRPHVLQRREPRHASRRGKGGRTAVRHDPGTRRWTTSACTSFIACTAAATTSRLPRPNKCTCTSTPRPRKAAPADAKVRAKLEAIRAAHAGLPLPPEAGRAIGQARMPHRLLARHAENRRSRPAARGNRPRRLPSGRTIRIRAGDGGAHRPRGGLHDRDGGPLLRVQAGNHPGGAAPDAAANRAEIDPRAREREANLLDVLSEALAIDAQRFTECAFWMAFWGQVSADKKLKRLNVWVHREYMRLFARCFAEYWREWPAWPPPCAIKCCVRWSPS